MSKFELSVLILSILSFTFLLMWRVYPDKVKYWLRDRWRKWEFPRIYSIGGDGRVFKYDEDGNEVEVHSGVEDDR